MKKTRVFLSVAMGAMFSIATLLPVGCATQTVSVDAVPITADTTARARYDNRFGEDKIPEQYENFGVGDPYILRHNGKYYLYCSAKSWVYGYKCWESDNLVDWTYLGHFNLLDYNGAPMDYDSMLSTNFAPEVYYWDGSFYFISSPRGKGHFIYKNDAPYGDFKAMSEARIDSGVYKYDGSVFIDDDESMYFLTPDQNAIRSYEFDGFEALGTIGYHSKANALNASSMNGTAEGPQVKKVNGTYYATFAGNFVESWGYRVGYSTLTASSLYASPFVVSADSVVLLDTLSEQHGLGHCTTTIGPNLDSYYMAYHTIDKDNVGFYREYNLNRVSYTRNRMSVNHALQGNEMPELPAFYVGADGNSYSQERTDALTETEGKLLSSVATGDVFTAEYNFKNVQTDGSLKLYFGSGDYYVTIVNKAIQLKKGNELIASGTLVNDFDFSKLHTVTVSHREGRIAVKFDDLTKIDITLVAPLTGGKIGYSGVARADVGATTFSGYAFGSSDETEAAIVDGSIWADNYMPEQSKLTGESGVKEIDYDDYDDYSAYSDTNALSLKTVGDYVTYKIDVNADGYYGIDGLIDRASFGGALGVQVDNAKPVTFNVGKIDFSSSDADFGSQSLYVKKQLGEISLTKGIHTVTFILAKGEFTAVSLEFYKSSEYAPSFSAALDSYVLQGSRYYSQFALADGAHFSDVNLNRLVMFGTNKLTDYKVSVDVKLSSEPSARRAGVVVRLNHPNYPFEAPGSDAAAMQGYFIYFDDEAIYAEKLNYSTELLASAEVDAPLEQYHKLEVVCKGNVITVYLNGEKKLNIVDSYAYTHGGVGLFSVTTEVYFKNLKVS